MSIACKKRQAVDLCDKRVSCGHNYQQPYNQSDTVMFQVSLTEYNDVEQLKGGDFAPLFSGTADGTTANQLIDNGQSFWSLGYSIVGWQVKNITDDTYATITAVNASGTTATLNADIFVSGENYEILPFRRTIGLLEYDETNDLWERAGASTLDYLTQPGALIDGQFYKATINVSTYVGGSVSISSATSQSAALEAAGTADIYFVASGTDFVIQTGGQLAISSVSLKLMSAVEVQVKDEDGVVVYQDDEYVTYYGDTAQVSFTWSDLGLSDGCYNIGVLDATGKNIEYIVNKNMTPLAQGTVTSGSATKIIDTAMNFPALNIFTPSFETFTGWNDTTSELNTAISGVSSTTITFSNGNGWTIGQSYEVYPWGAANNITFTNGTAIFTAAGAFFEQSLIDFGNTLVTGKTYKLKIVVDAFTSAFSFSIGDSMGNFSVDFAITSAGTFEEEFELTDWEGAIIYGSGVGTISQISIVEVPTAAVLESETIALATAHTDTLKITYSNDEDFVIGGSALDYENFTFEQVLRIEAKIWQPRWEADRELYSFTNMSFKTVYDSDKEVWRITTGLLPHWIHAAFRAGLAQDNLDVDGTVFFAYGQGYEPEWEKEIGSVTVEVVEDLKGIRNSC